jgi:transposase
MSDPSPLPPDLWSKTPADVQAAVLALVQSFERRIADLEARLKRDSSNSSKPPSSEPLHVKRQPPRPRSGRRPGGQPGHKRHARQLVPPERLAGLVECRPDGCCRCGFRLHGDDPEPVRHQVAEVPEIRPEVVEYRLHRLTCPRCGVTTRGRLPAGVPRGGFGPRLQSLLSVLGGVYRLSKRLVRRLAGDLLGLEISTGAVAKLQRRTAEALARPMEQIVAAVRSAPAVHVDETGWREEGRKAWLWVAATGGATAFQIHRSRGGKALEALLGTDPGEGRVIISDRFPTYARAPNRQLCWAHLRRDFTAMIDRAAGGESVGQRLLDQSRWIYTWWGGLRGGSLSRSTFRAYVAGLRRTVEYLLREGAGCPCRWTATVCRSLLEAGRHLWTFAAVEGVAPDNNAAERALRHGVIWRKLSLGTASASGSRFVERMLSVVETCRQRGRDVLAFLTGCVRSALEGLPAPNPLA